MENPHHVSVTLNRWSQTNQKGSVCHRASPGFLFQRKQDLRVAEECDEEDA
jgi:hypothetical protein